MRSLNLSEIHSVSGGGACAAIFATGPALLAAAAGTGLAAAISPIVAYQNYQKYHSVTKCVSAVASHMTLGLQMGAAFIESAYKL